MTDTDSSQRVTLVDRVYEEIMMRIVSGALEPGTVLSEVAVAKELDMSRTPVHDALRQLAKDGLVERETGRRAMVAPFTRDDVFEIFEMRLLLETRAAELAATRMDLRHLRPLQREIAELRATFGAQQQWKARWVDHDGRFHAAIAKGSGQHRLAQDIERYRLLHRGLNQIRTEVEALDGALDEHLAILQALEINDAPAARDRMETHLRTWQQYFVDHFD